MDNSLEKLPNSEETPNHATRRKNYRPAIFAVVLLLIAGAVAFIFALNHNKKPDNNSDNTTTAETSKEEKSEEKPKATETTKEPESAKEAEEPEKAPEEIVQNKAPVKQEGEDPNTLSELTGVINYAAVNDGTLMIRVSIDQYLDSGTCLLEMTSASDSFSLSDNIMPSASTSSCSYDIATSLLNSGDNYDIKITLNSENKQGIIKGEVKI
ncbi:hypothetical protein IKG73_02265 [Candidatus Saccharibacteria bacterium]|nr:hypothetical protein [Candidatus Saccharibacteria bacterium]